MIRLLAGWILICGSLGLIAQQQTKTTVDNEGNKMVLDLTAGAMTIMRDGTTNKVSAAQLNDYCGNPKRFVGVLDASDRAALNGICKDWIKLQGHASAMHVQTKREPPHSPKTAHDYYDELYKAGGLDNFADEYACFRDDDVPTFFLIGKSEDMREYLAASGGLSKLPPEARAYLDKARLFFVSYNQGISNGTEYFSLNDSGDSYIEKLEMPPDQYSPKSFRLTVRLRVNWQTLRYKHDIEKTGVPGFLYEETGRCEVVKPGVQQHGHKE